MTTKFTLQGKTALVTGASSGIGRRQAFALAQAGASVVLLGRRQANLDEAVSEITTAGGNAVALAADLNDRTALQAIQAKADEAFGSVDIIINAAGVNFREPVDEITLDSWDKTINLNLAVPFFLSREFVPGMMRNGWGRVINIASLQSSRAFANGLAYGASKGGVAQLTRAMAQAWSASGVGCNAIAPGFFPTELTAPVYDNDALIDQLANQTAIGRNGELTDVDGLTVFLASPASNYVTGQVIYLDGGFSAK